MTHPHIDETDQPMLREIITFPPQSKVEDNANGAKRSS